MIPRSGLFLVHKPSGCTSTTVCRTLKRLLREAGGEKKPKIGHIGTLDPFAEGLLPVATGEGTKLIPHLNTQTKDYQFTLAWGFETETGDFLGAPGETSPHRPTATAIEGTLPQFRGAILQIPPRFSALKIGGKRAYTLARAGETFELQPRPQTIFSLDLIEASTTHAILNVRCNTGTYVRTLAQDLARALGTRGHLTALCRTAVGEWPLARATPLYSLEEIVHGEESLRSFWLSPREMLDDIPALFLDTEQIQKVCRGQSIPVPETIREVSYDTVVSCLDVGGSVRALGHVREGMVYPFRVLLQE